MSSHPTNYNSHGRPLRQSPTSDSHSGQSYSDQGRTTLPPLTIAFPTSDPPVHNNYLYPYPTQQRSTTPASSQQHYYPPAQQQTQASYPYSSYPPHSEQSRHYGGQAYGSHNRASPSFSSADPRRHPPPPPPLDVPREGWPGPQGSQYYSTQADLQTQHTSNDMRSPHAVYPPASNYPPYQSQYQSLSATTYSAGHNRGAPPPVATASQQYHQHQSMSMSQRTMPSSRTSTQLPYARPDIVTEEVVLPEPAEPAIKKKRKRADARQLEMLNATYARTAFPSTEERAALAKELDMSARSVQIWFQNKRQQARQGGRNAAGTSNPPLPVSTPTPSAGYRGSPVPVSPMVETSGPTYSSRSPPPGMMRSGQTPSPPSGRPDYSRHWPRSGY